MDKHFWSQDPDGKWAEWYRVARHEATDFGTERGSWEVREVDGAWVAQNTYTGILGAFPSLKSAIQAADASTQHILDMAARARSVLKALDDSR
jgi:hypothetical protein